MQEDIVADEEEPCGAHRKGGIQSSQKLLLVIEIDNRGSMRPANADGVVGRGIVQQDEVALLRPCHQGSKTAIQGRLTVMAQHCYGEIRHESL